MEITPGTTIKNRYRIDGLLGKGGMGAVYKGMDTSVDRMIALKANLSPTSHARKQFEREARLLAGLRHPNLPLVTDHFIEGEIQYLVMDFIPGSDLSELLKKDGAQPVEEVLGWAKQLSSALTYLHTQDPPIIHRDIKPANIKITPNGEVVLVDFGIAKTTASGSTVTSTGARGYTPGYAPPEQYGASPTNQLSDQYALAATLYAMMVGYSPTESIERMLGQEELVLPRDANKKIPEHVDYALQRAMNLQSEDRFADVNEFVRAITDPIFESTVRAKTKIAMRQPEVKRGGGGKIIGPILAILALVAVVVISLGNFGGDDTANNISNQDSQIVDTNVISTEAPEIDGQDATFTPIPPTITLTPEPSPTFTPTIMPTQVGAGGLIAFVSNRVDARYFQVFTMRADGSEVTQITFDPVSKSQPTWSPDGTQILYVAHGGTSFGTDLGLDIWLIDADGSNPTNLTFLPGDDYDPTWIPDGSRIAFATTRVNDLPQIFFMNADGSDPQFISRGYAVEAMPEWSPNGEWLLLGISINSSPYNLWLRTGAGQNPRLFDLSRRVGAIEDPAWSPDGFYIAFTHIESDRNEIYLVVVEEHGNTIIQLTNSLGNRHPDWSPDGQWIIFSSTRDQNSEIYIMTVTGQIQTNISNHESDDREPSWQPAVTGGN